MYGRGVVHMFTSRKVKRPVGHVRRAEFIPVMAEGDEPANVGGGALGSVFRMVEEHRAALKEVREERRQAHEAVKAEMELHRMTQKRANRESRPPPPPPPPRRMRRPRKQRWRGQTRWRRRSPAVAA